MAALRRASFDCSPASALFDGVDIDGALTFAHIGAIAPHARHEVALAHLRRRRRSGGADGATRAAFAVFAITPSVRFRRARSLRCLSPLVEARPLRQQDAAMQNIGYRRGTQRIPFHYSRGKISCRRAGDVPHRPTHNASLATAGRSPTDALAPKMPCR